MCNRAKRLVKPEISEMTRVVGSLRGHLSLISLSLQWQRYFFIRLLLSLSSSRRVKRGFFLRLALFPSQPRLRSCNTHPQLTEKISCDSLQLFFSFSLSLLNRTRIPVFKVLKNKNHTDLRYSLRGEKNSSSIQNLKSCRNVILHLYLSFP